MGILHTGQGVGIGQVPGGAQLHLLALLAGQYFLQLLAAVFRHIAHNKGVQDADAQQTAHGIHGKQGIKHLKHNHHGHRDPKGSDGFVVAFDGFFSFPGNDENIDGGGNKQQYLESQQDVPHHARVVVARGVKPEHQGGEDIEEQDQAHQYQEHPSGDGKELHELAVQLQVKEHIPGPHEHGGGHGNKIQHGVRRCKRNKTGVIEDAPQDICYIEKRHGQDHKGDGNAQALASAGVPFR